MGSPPGDWFASEDERPQRSVSISKSFAISKFEITFDDWMKCVSENGCNSYFPDDNGWGQRLRPVINVSWMDAKTYTDWLSKKTGQQYRLPTEAEWEYAARAGSQSEYSFGETIDLSQANFSTAMFLDDGFSTGSTPEQGKKRTVKVGRYASSQFGLYDMHGNVEEWVEDCYRAYLETEETNDDYENERCEYRVLRGGSWSDLWTRLRSSSRRKANPASRASQIGFRVLREIE